MVFCFDGPIVPWVHQIAFDLLVNEAVDLRRNALVVTVISPRMSMTHKRLITTSKIQSEVFELTPVIDDGLVLPVSVTLLNIHF
jgi:hypothetical protein